MLWKKFDIPFKRRFLPMHRAQPLLRFVRCMGKFKFSPCKIERLRFGFKPIFL